MTRRDRWHVSKANDASCLARALQVPASVSKEVGSNKQRSGIEQAWLIRPFFVSVSCVEAQAWVGGRSACGYEDGLPNLALKFNVVFAGCFCPKNAGK